MSTSTPSRRRQVQRLALAGVGSAVLLVGIAPAAAAADDVVLPLAPTEVGLLVVATENSGGASMDPFLSSSTSAPVVPAEVHYGDTLTVDLPEGLDPAGALVEIAFDDLDGDGVPDKVYSNDPAATDPLVVTTVGNDLEIVLPTDDTVNGPLAFLSVDPVETDPSVLGPEFFLVEPVLEYALDFSAAAPSAPTLFPEVLALAQVPCGLSSPTACPVAVTAGGTLTLDLTAESALRDLGLTDLAGIEVALQKADDPDAAPVLLAAQVNGSTATLALPAELAAGSYALVLGQPTLSGVSIVLAELAVAAPVAPQAAAPTTAAPEAVVVNAGLRSNTGVEAAEGGSAGTVAVAGGAGLLLLAGAGGVAVVRGRRRAADGA